MWETIHEWSDEVFGRLLVWFLGDPDHPGAAERGVDWARRQARRLRFWMLVGIIAPPAAAILGWLLSEEIPGTDVTSVPIGRFVMGVGMAIGLPILIVVGGAAATAATVLSRGFGAKPENADAFVRGYAAMLIWYIFALDLMMLIGVRATLPELFGGIIAGVVLGLIAFAWDYALGWGRAVVFTYFIVRVVLILTGLTPDGFWMDTVGYPVASSVQTLGVAHDNHAMLAAARADAATRRDASATDLRRIIRRMETGTIDERLAAADEYAAWKKKYAGGILGAVYRFGDMGKK